MAYAQKFPEEARGLMLSVNEKTTRLQLIATFGGGEPNEISVLAITEGRDVLELARLTVVPAAPSGV